MTTVDELFDRFRAAYRSGEETDPREFLAGLSGADRRELEALIDAFLAHAPAAEVDVARFRASPAGQRLRAALEATAAETWAELLPRLRDDAQLTRAKLVARLAEALGVGGREPKVARYYHRMETGDLLPSGVSDRVLEALGAIVGASAERLRAAGLNIAPPRAAGEVFGRSVTAAPAPASAPPRRQAGEDHDEVDQLFTGG